jgi:two-component system, NarL family, invasion response regulator UvrY
MQATGCRQEGHGAGGRTVIEVLVVDDHQLLRQGLMQLMEEEPDMEVAGEAGSIAGLMEKLAEREWDVLVLDVSLPDRGGLEALKEIKGLRPEMPVLILSMHSDSRYARQALENGASGYVTKASAAEEVITAVRRVVGGGVYLSEAMAGKLSAKGGDARGS